MPVLALIAAVAMLASLFLPWANADTIGASIVPWDYIKQMSPDLDTAKRFVTESPTQLVAFAATFVLAGLFAVFAGIGLPSRLLALLSGGTAVGLMALQAYRLKDVAARYGLPLPDLSDLQQLAKIAPDYFGAGAFAWAGGAVVLFLAGLLGFSRR